RTKTYTLSEKYKGDDFLITDKWSYYSSSDPTGGQVDYLSHSAAVKERLAYLEGSIAVLAVDNKTDLPLHKNRNSVRITSKKKYNNGLFIADFYQMPHGCSIWPAWWSVGPDWPNGGEIDIVENINLATNNQYTLHSGSGSSCTLAQPVHATGRVLGTQCMSAPDANAGCAIVDNDPRTFGHGFNAGGGGVFAHLWDSTGITFWHFARDEIPADITAGKPEPRSWPTPAAVFSSAGCDFYDHFYDHSLVLDTTLCGGYAGGANYPNSGCPGTCEEVVADKSNFDRALYIHCSICLGGGVLTITIFQMRKG
ncbi:hypothetical protein BV25DRAFT_1806255, partial [Artomyces pyxidatus]